jgi:hypothetical protein
MGLVGRDGVVRGGADARDRGGKNASDELDNFVKHERERATAPPRVRWAPERVRHSTASVSAAGARA